MSREKLEQMTQALESQLLENPQDKLLKKAVRKLRKDLLPRLLKYEQYQRLLGGQEQLQQDGLGCNLHADEGRPHAKRPAQTGYNVQFGTENHFILAYAVHQITTDTLPTIL